MPYAKQTTDPIEDLRATGLTVEPTEEVVDHGFAIKDKRLLVDGAPVFVYQIADITATETASAVSQPTSTA